MIHAFTSIGCLTRLRLAALGALAVFAGSACGDTTDPLATNDPSEPVAPVTLTDSVATTDTISFASASTRGTPFGPFGLWSSWTTVYWGPKPMTSAQQCVNPSGIVKFINTARLMGQALMLQMTCGAPSEYMTNGKFDLSRWKKVMNGYNTSAIRNAIAAGVQDGTVAGNSMIDEPETKRWNNSVTKGMLDQAAVYAKSLFPSLPQGVSHGSTGYNWRTSERFTKVDYVNYQYVWRATTGNAGAYRDAVLTQSKRDGVATSFSLNILGGGVQDTDGNYNCTGSGQAGKGPYYPTCRMTADQVRNWGKTLGVGCMLLMWRYDGAYFSRSDNQSAFRDLASAMAAKSRQSCRRPG